MAKSLHLTIFLFRAEEASLSCQDRTCIEIDPVPRPNQVCRGVSDGCCTGGIICNRV